MKYECNVCEGTGLIQSEDGSKTKDCYQCQGSGSYNHYTDSPHID
ncbi:MULTISPECIES: hypothetical protein [unclassified Tenacibaculum]|nr:MULTISPECIES: hypothetical protein [unclassified Tenacibaculum]